MFGRFAFAGLMAAIVLCGGAAPAPKHGAAAGNAGREAAAQPIATPKPAKPYAYPYDCARPLSAQQDNLCLQRRAIETADKWGRLTFRAGLAIAIGIFLVFLATVAAAWAAVMRAAAAMRSAKIAEKSLARAATITPEPAQSEPRPVPRRSPQRQQSPIRNTQ